MLSAYICNLRTSYVPEGLTKAFNKPNSFIIFSISFCNFIGSTTLSYKEVVLTANLLFTFIFDVLLRES